MTTKSADEQYSKEKLGTKQGASQANVLAFRPTTTTPRRLEAAPTANFIDERTRCIENGRQNTEYRPLVSPIVTSTTFMFKETSEIYDFQAGKLPHEYGRYGNPTLATTEKRLAALEGGEDAVLFASGMAAITSVLFSLLQQGDHIILGSDTYRRTREFCTSFLGRFGITTSVVEMGDYAALAASIRPETKLIFLESPTNPFLRVVDLKKLIPLAKASGIITVIDSTFATPINQRPLEFGVDLVIHSATKYLGGHHDILSGVVIGSGEIIAKVRQDRGVLGGIADSETSARIERSVKTLALRVKQHNEGAFALARYLEKHPLVKQVWYPGLESHPDYAVAKEQMHGFGGVVTFDLHASAAQACTFVDSLQIALLADSLGGAETLVKPVALMSFFKYSPEERLKLGITDTLIRLSVGLESPDDIIADIEQALGTISGEIDLVSPS